MKDISKLNLRDVIGFEGLYKISECGVVISVERYSTSLDKEVKPRLVKQKIKSQRKDKDGYLRTELSKNGATTTARIHQLVLKSFVGLPEGERNEVNHKDGNKENNHVSNLEWVTKKENINHAWETGLKVPTIQKKGWNHSRSKLSKKDRDFILASDLSYRKLGDMFGVHHSIVYGIKKGIRYAVKE